jgi:hypothetical protein
VEGAKVTMLLRGCASRSGELGSAPRKDANGSTAPVRTKVKAEKVAAVPMPSIVDAEPPARVVTSLELTLIARTARLLESATYSIISLASNARPTGLLNAAAVPTPFVRLVQVLPASVEEVPTRFVTVTRFILQLEEEVGGKAAKLVNWATTAEM